MYAIVLSSIIPAATHTLDDLRRPHSRDRFTPAGETLSADEDVCSNKRSRQT